MVRCTSLIGININLFGILLSHTALPSAPGLMVAPGTDLQSFIFTITLPTPPDCVVNYSISVSGSDGSVATITVPASGRGRSSPDFDLCANTYSFTVTAVTHGGNGMTSSSVSLMLSNNTGKEHVCCHQRMY